MAPIPYSAPSHQRAAAKAAMKVSLEAMAVPAAAVLGNQMPVVRAILQAFPHLKVVTEARDNLA
jgi:hypothetical protein